MSSLGRKDVIVEPLLKGQIIGQPAKEGHGQMGVGIDQPGQNQAAAGIDDHFRIGEVLFIRQRFNADNLVGLGADQPVFDDLEPIVDGDNGAVVDHNVVRHSTSPT